MKGTHWRNICLDKGDFDHHFNNSLTCTVLGQFKFRIGNGYCLSGQMKQACIPLCILYCCATRQIGTIPLEHALRACLELINLRVPRGCWWPNNWQCKYRYHIWYQQLSKEGRGRQCEASLTGSCFVTVLLEIKVQLSEPNMQGKDYSIETNYGQFRCIFWKAVLSAMVSCFQRNFQATTFGNNVAFPQPKIRWQTRHR